MSTQLSFARDAQGYNAFGPQFPTDIYTATLASGTHSSITIPGNNPAYLMVVRIEPAGWVWVSRGGTAAVPAAGTFATAVSELIAGTIEYKRIVYPKDVIDFITANTTCDIEVALFAIAYP